MNGSKSIGALLFETNDLGIATWLKFKGMEIKTMVKDRNKTKFVFIDKPERKEWIRNYFNGKAMVDALTYKNLLRDLKVFTLSS